MAYCHVCLPVAWGVDELPWQLSDLLRGLGLEVEEFSKGHDCLYASDPPRSGRRLGDQVALVCDWSNLRNTGEVELELRSGESMARGATRAETLCKQLCERLQNPEALSG